jgi:hypothetical protein
MFSDSESLRNLRGTRQCVDWLLITQQELLSELSPAARSCLQDLSCALRLEDDHGARTTGSVWQGVRDVVLPRFRILADENGPCDVA